jgi:hypothetical protein
MDWAELVAVDMTAILLIDRPAGAEDVFYQRWPIDFTSIAR